jgi:hypothetical protein
MDIVYAKSQFSVGSPAGPVKILPGEAWDANSDVVKGHPELFSEVPVRVRSDGGWVETATAVPGEKRKSGR